MKHHCYTRVLSGIVLPLVLWSVSTLALAESLVWFSDHKSLKAVDTATDEIVSTIAVPQKPTALAADSTGNVWVARSSRLTKYAPTGSVMLEVDLSRSSTKLKHPRFVLANPYSDSLWAAGGRDVLLLSEEGQRLAEWRFNRKIEGIALDIDESVWILGHREMAQLSKSGAFIRSVAIDTNLPDPDFIAIDGLGSIVWVVANQKLAKYDINQPAAPPTIIDLPHSIVAVDVHPVFGTLWLATNKQLLLYDRSGQAIKTVVLPSDIGRVHSMRFDPKSLSLWVGGKNRVFRFSSTGQLRTTIAADKKVESVGVAAPTLSPTLAITDPSGDSLTNNPHPRIQLSLGAACTYTPCLLPEDYFRSLSLDIKLNGVAIGSFFEGSASEPYYIPQDRLPEGRNLLTAKATDLFGHQSAETAALFVVDTVPPMFVSVAPTSGTTVNEPNIVISGTVDDATANVVLNDGSGNGAMAGANFSFSTVLAAGTNTFTLSANDPAGNIAQLPLSITYQPPTASRLQVKQPLPGSSVVGDTVVISGTFASGPNTGITINGVLAQLYGDQFFADIGLVPGQNTITVVATDIDGEVAREEFTVSASGTTDVGVEQVAPRTASIETIAGTGEAGFTGDIGPAKLAQLYYPDVSAIGADGSLYFQDADNSVIRRIAPDGTITTFAGNGASHSAGDGGPATGASFGWISDMAFGPDGSLYLAEGSRIRRIDISGIIQTIAGSSYGYSGDGGPAVNALFRGYLHLAVAADGAIYVSDYYNQRLRKIDNNGIVTTIAGNGEEGYSGDGEPAAAAVLRGPEHLALAANGDLYLYDSENAVVRRIDAAGVISTVVGDGAFGDGANGVPANAVQLGYLAAIKLDPVGRLYMLDFDYSKVRRLNGEGLVETIAGTGEHNYGGDNGPPSQASFLYPYGMSIAADGTLYLSDTESHRIRAFNLFLPEETSSLTAAFEVTSVGVEISRIDVDFDSDGTIDRTVNSNRLPLQHQYPSPGVYEAKFIITDMSGKTHTVASQIVVKDVNDMDAMLRAVYKTMLDRLRVGDVNGALNTISGGMRAKYEAVFNALKPNLAAVVDQLGTLESATIGEELAEYVLIRGQGEQAQAFLIYFIRSEDGVWRIDGM